MTAHAISPHAETRLVPAAVAAGVLAAATAGWVVLARRMAGMDTSAGGGAAGLGSLGWFAVTWLVMTAAMMLPGAAPAVVRAARHRRATPAASAAGFVVAYGAVWLLAGLAGYACVQAVRALDVGALGWASAGRYVAAAAVLAAGLYQLTPAKRRWLERCTAPERHLPRPGPFGALQAGAGHGICCVACCGTLMIALYALGIMSIPWMVVLTVLIAGERLVPRRSFAVVAAAAVLVALGAGIAVAASSVPALTIPSTGHPAGMGMGSAHAAGQRRGQRGPHALGMPVSDLPFPAGRRERELRGRAWRKEHSG
jgi:predicted metal-binding membrane protein